MYGYSQKSDGKNELIIACAALTVGQRESKGVKGTNKEGGVGQGVDQILLYL